MTKIEVIDSGNGISLVTISDVIVAILPRKGEWIKLRECSYHVHRVQHEFIPTATGADTLIHIYVDKQ